MSRQPLGQHFLKNKKATEVVLNALGAQAGETIVEIGPGHGEITLPLLELCKEKKCTVVAIERDAHLVDELASLRVGGLEVIHGDALKLLKSQTQKLTNYSLVGNLPYYLTGHLLRIISELHNKPRHCIFMIQREVAERIVASPPRMNLLAASVQVWADAKIIMHLSPQDFSPPPDVHSAIISLSTSPYHLVPSPYYQFIKKLFKQPRKTILNNLADGYELPKEAVLKILEENKISTTARPQNLDLESIIILSSALESLNSLVLSP